MMASGLEEGAWAAILSCRRQAALLSSAAHASAPLSPSVDPQLTRASCRAQTRKWSPPSAFFARPDDGRMVMPALVKKERGGRHGEFQQ
jgi:hypothetical protein